jgi:hypothetical protein
VLEEFASAFDEGLEIHDQCWANFKFVAPHRLAHRKFYKTAHRTG